MQKKGYQKPVIKKVNLNITESVLTACKTAIKMTQPKQNNKACNGGPSGSDCLTDTGS